MDFDWKEIIGMSATLIIFFGFTQSGIVRVRIVNSIGSILFIVYGILIGSFSVWILNGMCLLLNIYKIIKEMRHPPIYARVVKMGKDLPDIEYVVDKRK